MNTDTEFEKFDKLTIELLAAHPVTQENAGNWFALLNKIDQETTHLRYHVEYMLEFV